MKEKIIKGYKYIKVNNKWIQEHRKNVENFIGRKLTKEEAVHHINLNKLDNRIENLMLFKTQKEHAHFHNQLIRFGYITNPMKNLIMHRWEVVNDSNIR